MLVVSAFSVSVEEEVADGRTDEDVDEKVDENVDPRAVEIIAVVVALNPELVTELILRVVLAMLSFAEANVLVSNSTSTPSAPLHPYLSPSRAHLKSMRQGYDSPGSL
jgi:hypothetical protein